MGMYDTIVVDELVGNRYDIRCSRCQKLFKTLQTKSLESCLLSYLLAFDPEGQIRLWQIETIPLNDMATFMSDWPHQHIRAYYGCDTCSENVLISPPIESCFEDEGFPPDELIRVPLFFEWDFKFTDGILEKVVPIRNG